MAAFALKTEYEAAFGLLKWPVQNFFYAQVIGGRGTASFDGSRLAVTIPEKFDFVWIKFARFVDDDIHMTTYSHIADTE